MTRAVAGTDLAQRIESQIPGSVAASDAADVWVRSEVVHDALQLLRDSDDLDFQFLNAVTAVDYLEFFELIYHLTSLRRNASCTVKTRLYSREDPSIPSVIDLWRGAELQEREIYDLMGITFQGHPNMKRILLWEGFPGHPLRKDFIR